ncbi:hypothetical protein ACO0LV_04490 [Pseudactinotalea sp. Z1739]|uniref:hypothetical protein n=1 Tax=Pseudactinotalea sp. Z1739 TaxID=3413028 RepID=UPI003C7A0A86
MPVRAWVLHRRDGWQRIDGEAVAYTPRAGRVAYVDEHGRTGAVWVWASAIERSGDS